MVGALKLYANGNRWRLFLVRSSSNVTDLAGLADLALDLAALPSIRDVWDGRSARRRAHP
jgi:hypothetical protein